MPKPQANLTMLRRILQQEVLNGKRLIELTTAQTDAITRREMSRLSHLEMEMRQCLDVQETLDVSRTTTTRDLAVSLGMETVPNLSGLLPKLPQRDRVVLSQLRTQILEIQAKLDTISARNKALIYTALDFVRFSLDILTEAAFQPARYGTNPASLAVPTLYIDSKV